MLKFNNLALTGWSYEKADKEITMAELAARGLPRSVQARNPVPATWVYEDESQWRVRLGEHVNRAVDRSGVDRSNIQCYMGVNNGYKVHPESAGPDIMKSLGQENQVMFDISLGRS